VNNDVVKKNSVAADPHLNGARVNITTGDLDPAMILTSIDLDITQEIPKLSLGEQTGCKGQG
jgi:hypothetical protein